MRSFYHSLHGITYLSIDCTNASCPSENTMKGSLIVSWLATISAAAAHPSQHARLAPLRHSNPFIPATRVSDLKDSNNTADSTSSNWSGAAISGSGLKSVKATFTMPHPQPPSSSATPTAGSGDYSGSAWVGIDGLSNQAAILQAGVTWSVSSGGATSYSGWIEWYPLPEQQISGWAVTAGDVVTISCTSSSPSKGSCTLLNQSSGKSTTQTVSAPSASATLTGANAEWIVEDYSSGGSLVPFANFGSVEFSSCSATTASGSAVDASGSQLIDLKSSSGKIITSVSEPSGSQVLVKYTG